MPLSKARGSTEENFDEFRHGKTAYNKGVSRCRGGQAYSSRRMNMTPSGIYQHKSKPLPNFIGKQFGRLTVSAFHGYDKHLHRIWRCECECGKEVYPCTGNLTSGNSTSCGCLASELRKLPTGRSPKGKLGIGVSAKNSTLMHYKVSARRRGHVWNISDAEAEVIFSSDCHYCGCNPCHYTKTKKMNGGFTYMGIDRVDSSLGYEPGNVVPCCRRCNVAKNDMREEEFYLWVERVYLNHHRGYKCR